VFLPNTAFVDGQELINLLRQHEIEWIVLAGFLRKISPELIAHFTNRIINIHPSLLPKYGGKGMYGMHVHEAVIEAKEPTSGITIHLVNEEFDKGEILAQYTTNLSNSDTPATLAQKIHALEHQFFPTIVEQTIQKSQL
ncbi:MAG TPA: formyltransferase family protein, partial [Fluviicola sp.]|nr:formyltransferase family protein [Fluviicola sp.]